MSVHKKVKQSLDRIKIIEKVGKPSYTKKQFEHALEMLESHSYNQVVEKTGISKSTLIRAMKKKRAE